MKYYKKLVGERIYLSPQCIEDAPKYLEWVNSFSTTDGLGTSSRVMSLPLEEEFLRRTQKEECQLAIVKLDNDELIGNASLFNIDHIRRIAITGLFIGPVEERNKGYGTEVLRLLVDYGFNYLNLHNIMLNVWSFNEAAIACYKKVGFKEIGRRRESCRLNGRYYDDVHMDILSSEWNESYIKNKYIK